MESCPRNTWILNQYSEGRRGKGRRGGEGKERKRKRKSKYQVVELRTRKLTSQL
jgi:hypothetical protein